MPIGAGLKQAVFDRDSAQRLRAADAPERVERLRPVRVTIGIATHDDYDGAFFTVESLRLHHREVTDQAEIIILDNHAGGIESEALALLARQQNAGANVRYIPFTDVHSTAVREMLFHEAQGEIVVVLDSHVLLAPGAMQAIVDFFADPSHARDMAHGPLLTYDAHRVTATHMDAGFRAGMYGTWGLDARGADPKSEPFVITLSGLGAFAMRRDAWPGLNPMFHGFGGEEGYIHEKVRQGGGQVYCLPAMRWIHRFERPRGVPYVNQWVDRIHNYLIGWAEIGYDLAPIDEHFNQLLPGAYRQVKNEALDLITEPARQVDGFVVLGDPERIGPWQRTLAALSQSRAECIREAIGSDEQTASPAWQRALHRARMRGWRSMVVLDESHPWTADDLRELALITVSAPTPSPQLRDQRPAAVVVPNLNADLTEVAATVAGWSRSEAPSRSASEEEGNVPAEAWLASTPHRELERVEQTDVSDGAVLFDTRNQVAHHLNPSAMLVWELIDGRTAEKIVDEVARTLEMNRPDAVSYVREALAQFDSLQLLRAAARAHVVHSR